MATEPENGLYNIMNMYNVTWRVHGFFLDFDCFVRKTLCSCQQVEQFWGFYSYLVRPGDLSGHSDIHLFKDGIKPMWEVR